VSGTATRRAVVTGAASGIGAATARRLLTGGIEVVAVDRDEAGLARLAKDGARPLVADVTAADDRARIADAAEGGDFLVNGAGIIRLEPIFEATPAAWRDIFAVNAEATFFLCQAIGPRLRAGGAVVNVSSASAKFAATTEVAIYAASKAAILSMTRSFAYGLASRPIRVNAVCPGIIDTAMQDRVIADVSRIRATATDELVRARLSNIPLARTGSPDECAAIIQFLLSDEAAYMTGQAVNVSGGMVMW
jgi:NAD(P)-dependent dehydrogenase (short-subunit alcohol dehydrogenase family)